MAPDENSLPFRFQFKWLIGPFAIIGVAVLLILFLPSLPEESPPVVELPPQPILVSPAVDVAAAKEAALQQCTHEYVCADKDCLEKVLTHVDSASQRIDAILRTPAPKEFRDRLRMAIKRGVEVNLVLDSTLNPKFFLEGANIRVKKISGFVTTNFLIVDREIVVYGSDPHEYAQSPDVLKVVCEEFETSPYILLFDRIWEGESTSFASETTEEEILADSELSIPSNNVSCQEEACGPDTFTCDGTTKVWVDYSCDSSCVYTILPLYFSQDCGYSTPGFSPEGNPLVFITETEVDEGQISNEFIEFTSTQSLELSNFSLTKDGELLITFPSPYILDGSAKVYTGTGVSTTNIIYLNQTVTLWKDPGTTASLVNPDGVVVATQTFEG
jgi:hypothetical protein